MNVDLMFVNLIQGTTFKFCTPKCANGFKQKTQLRKPINDFKQSSQSDVGLKPTVRTENKTTNVVVNKPDEFKTTPNDKYTYWLNYDTRYAKVVIAPFSIARTRLRSLQFDDTICYTTYQYVVTKQRKYFKELPKVFKNHLKNNEHYHIRHDLLCYNTQIYCRVVLRSSLIEYIHIQYHHIRYEKMIQVMCRKYFWPSIRLDIQRQLSVYDIYYHCSGNLPNYRSVVSSTSY